MVHETFQFVTIPQILYRHVGCAANQHNLPNGSSLVGHLLGGVIAIPTLGVSVGASTAHHAVQKGILLGALKLMARTRPGQISPQFLEHSRAARAARDRSAPAIVRKWGEEGRTYLENTARLSDDSAMRYMNSFSNLGGAPNTTKAALKDSGITAASVELELARIAEVNIADPDVRFGGSTASSLFGHHQTYVLRGD